MKKVNLILSGGFGTRLWPISQPDKPKQFLPYFEGKTLFQHCVDRNEYLVDEYLVVTNEAHAQLANPILETTAHKPYSLLLEPEPRNSAAAIAWACSTLDKDTLVLVSPSDQIIEKQDNYSQAIERAFELATKGKIVTLGVSPTEPHTGFGYIQSNGEDVLRFVEKPDEATAKSYLQEGNYSWNAGMFVFTAGTLLRELELHSPDIFKEVMKLTSANIQNQFGHIPSTSIDYAVMEKTSEMAIVKGDFGWTDLGSLEAFFDYFSAALFKPQQLKDKCIWSDLPGEHWGSSTNSMVVTANGFCISLPYGDGQKVKQIREAVLNPEAKS